MRNVPPPTTNSTAYYDARVGATQDKQHRRRLRRISKKVKTAYADYDANKKQLENISASPISASSDKEALQNLYTRNRTRIRALIIESWPPEDRDSCPLCALGEPHTLDHYVPEGAFPEFCLHLPNLVPACGKCQGHKLSRFVENGDRLFVHCYYDLIDGHRMLECTIDFSTSPPSCAYGVRRPKGVSATVFALVQSHFEKLKLGDRYVRKAAARIGKDLAGFRKQYAAGVSFQEIRAECKREVAKMRSRYGRNHWETAFYRTLAAKLPESALQ